MALRIFMRSNQLKAWMHFIIITFFFHYVLWNGDQSIDDMTTEQCSSLDYSKNILLLLSGLNGTSSSFLIFSRINGICSIWTLRMKWKYLCVTERSFRKIHFLFSFQLLLLIGISIVIHAMYTSSVIRHHQSFDNYLLHDALNCFSDSSRQFHQIENASDAQIKGSQNQINIVNVIWHVNKLDENEQNERLGFSD